MLFRCCFASLLLMMTGTLWAQAETYDPAKQVHWATAAFFGTGWYQVDENRTAYIFRIPPRQTFRESGWHENGKRKIGVEVQYPLALGIQKLDDLPDFIEFENYGTMTFTPGVKLEIPINDRWYLRPSAHLGVGYERESDEWATIWYGSLNSRYHLKESDKSSWNFLSALSYAGYKPEFQSRGSYGSAMVGVESDHLMNRFQLGGDPVWLNLHLTYSYLFDDLNFHVSETEYTTVRDVWEFGVALGLGRHKLKLWFLEFEHVGLSFKRSSNGTYQAISFNLRSPFNE